MKKLILIAALLVPSCAQAQNAITQTGTVVVGQPLKFTADHKAGRSGDLLGDAAGVGLAPHAITDNNGLALCANTAATTGTYSTFCFGHSAAGAPIFSVDGTEYSFPGTGNGNIVGPTTTIVGNVLAWNNVSGSLVLDAGAPGRLAVATNTALKALVIGSANGQVSVGTVVARAAFATAGDNGDALYRATGSACTLGGGAGDNGAEVKPTAGSNVCFVLIPDSFGPRPEVWGASISASDNSTALQSWLDYAVGHAISLGYGTFDYKTPLTLTNASSVSIRGVGPGGSVLNYTGANTTNDLFVLGDGATARTYLHVGDFRITSGTTMTGGAAFRARAIQHSDISVSVGEAGVAPTIYNGVWIDGGGDVRLSDYQVFAIADHTRINGLSSPSFSNADVAIDHGYMGCQAGGSSVGLHIAGGFGGLYVANLATEACNYGGLVDTSVTALGNRELFFGSGTTFDLSGTDNLRVNDALASGGTIGVTGGWYSTATGSGINIVAWAGTVSIGGGTVIQGNGADGIKVQDANTNINIGASTAIHNNTGWGVNATVATYLIRSQAAAQDNGSGAYSANSRVQFFNSGTNGYYRDGAGIYHEFITTSFTGAATTILTNAVTWPLAFPNGVLFDTAQCTLSGFANAAQQISVSVSSVTQTGADVSIVADGTVTSAQPVRCTISGY